MRPETPLRISHFIGADQPDLLEQTIGEMLDSIVSRYPDQDALVVRHQNIRWTYRQYLTEIDKLAGGLLAIGIRPGDRVGIWAPNCYEWCLTQFATARIGAIMVCINPAYRVFELEYALNKSGCRAIVAAERFKSSRYLEMMQSMPAGPGSKIPSPLPNLWSTKKSALPPASACSMKPTGWRRF